MGSAIRVSLPLLATLFATAVLLFVSGCSGELRRRPEAPHGPSLDAGWRALEAGRIDDARGIFLDHAMPRRRDHYQRGQANLGLGKCALAKGDVDSAIPYLERASHLLAGSGWGATCEMSLAEAHLGRARQETTDPRVARVSHERARLHLEAAYPSLDGRSRQWAAGLLSVFYEAEGFDAQASEWRGQAGPYVDSDELDSVRREVLPQYTARRSRDRLRQSRTSPTARRAALSKVQPSGRYFSRKKWRAARLIAGRVVPMNRVTRMTIHHTGEPDHVVIQSAAQATEYLRKMQHFAQSESGWADIGYHYLIDGRGIVYEGRPLRYQGAHAGGDLNRGNLGIALIGNFDKARPTNAQLRALQQLVLGLRTQHRITLSRIQAHSTVNERGGRGHTDCPGRHLRALIPGLFATEAGGGRQQR